MSIFIAFTPTPFAHSTLDGQLTANTPEPASMSLLGAGIAGLLLRKRRAKRISRRPMP
jgi:hypothetical protein